MAHAAERLSDLNDRLERRMQSRPVIRSASFALSGFVHKVSAIEIAVANKADTNVVNLTRAATQPASESGAASAALVTTGMSEFLQAGPATTISVVINASTKFKFGAGVGGINIRSLLASASAASFVKPADMIAVRQHIINNAMLWPRSLKSISVFDREIFNLSQPNIETAVRAVMTKSIPLGAELEMFSATAPSETGPGGLRNGIDPKAASAATTRDERIALDVGTVVGAVSVCSGNDPIFLIANPVQAAALRLRPTQVSDLYPVLASSGVPEGMLIALSSSGLITGIDPTPRFELSDTAMVQLDDAPVSDGSIAATTVSMFQSDMISLRMVSQVAWTLATPLALAWIETVAW